MRCVGYAKRMSCADSRVDVPIKEQNDRIRAYCKENGYELVGLYEDKSTDVNKDTGFMKMKADGMKRSFDFIVADSVYRCGMTVSNAKDLLQMTFFAAGIGFVFLEDGFCSEGKSMAELDKYFLDAIKIASLRVFADKRRNDWDNRIFSVHDEKYGYHLSDDKRSFAIDEEAAQCIRKVFELADSGMKAVNIRDYMNKNGYEAYGIHLRRVACKKRGQFSDKWTTENIKTILTTTSYKGLGTRNLDGVTYEYDIPAIVSQELYDRVQKKLPRIDRKRKVIRPHNAFLLRIYDAKTGNHISINRLETGERVFSEKQWRPNHYISYTDVMRKVITSIKEEKIVCEEAIKYFKTSACEQFIEQKRDELYASGVEAFKRIVAAEKGNIPLFLLYDNGEMSKEEYDNRHIKILNDIKTETESLDILIAQEEHFLKQYSMDNPWIQMVSAIKVPEVLTSSDVRKWIDRIVIHDYKSVEVVMKHHEWRVDPRK